MADCIGLSIVDVSQILSNLAGSSIYYDHENSMIMVEPLTQEYMQWVIKKGNKNAQKGLKNHISKMPNSPFSQYLISYMEGGYQGAYQGGPVVSYSVVGPRRLEQ
jgi:hypothetical protein